ncbi:phage recombination protein Bet [Fructilactobacillus florum DSM 22689 = JCM 16035]|uniref:Phage recombination protein Bet n=2 Tax=Fructilactobacillus florum TaxID=640331 RepID=A0A0R2CDI8_9LACO|nr:phage recombination protein Bet [Fructilactobacillus florum]KRM89809.1 phage recombination protein Bet [Fructilactobacillus florum DSM 22689 = JCM 16035]
MNHSVDFVANGQEVKLSGNTVKEYLVSGNGKITDQEVVMFLNLCKYQKLNPLINEAYLVKFGSQPAQIIVSKEAFMKRANSDPHFKGIKAGIIVQRNDDIKKLSGAIKLPSDKLLGGWAEVKRDDRDYPTEVEISLDEFGKGQATWKQMPMNMIRKTAIVNALREAFPDQLGSMYTEDEPDVQSEERKQVEETESQDNPKTVDELLKSTDKQTLETQSKTNSKTNSKTDSTDTTKDIDIEETKQPETAKDLIDDFKDSEKEGATDGKAGQEELFPKDIESKFE